MDHPLYTQSLTHRSVQGQPNYERLELVGDAVVQLAVTELLYRLHPTASEGLLSQLRTNLVCAKSLALCARTLDLPTKAVLGKSDEHRRHTDDLCADLFEAHIGMKYLLGGHEALELVCRLLGPRAKNSVPEVDPKSKLQEFTQAKGWGVPNYVLAASGGPDHDKRFTVIVKIGNLSAHGSGRSRKAAEHHAAEKLYAIMKLYDH